MFPGAPPGLTAGVTPQNTVAATERAVLAAIGPLLRSFWFHPDHGQTIIAGEYTAWLDYLTDIFSGHIAINCTDPSVGYRPLETTLTNGCPALGSNPTHVQGMNLSGTNIPAGSHTFCVVVDVSSVDTDQQALWTSAGTGEIGFELNAGSETIGLLIKNVGNFPVPGAQLVTGLADICWVYDADTGTCDVYYNGQQIGTLTGQIARAMTLYELGGPTSWHGKLASVAYCHSANPALAAAFHQWAVARCGVPEWYSLELPDALENQSAPDFRTAFAERTITIDGATKVVVEWLCQLRISSQDEIALLRNGTLHTTCPSEVTGANRQSVILAGGSQQIIVRDGPMHTSWSYYGNRAHRILSNAPIVADVVGAPTKRLVVLGDSITAGYVSDHPTSEAWPVLIRDAAAYAVSCYSSGSLGLYQVASDPELLAATVAILVELCDGTVSNVIWVELGFVDFYNGWGVSAFQSAYDALLTAIHAALPDATVFAQTPITAAPDTGLPAYRAAIATAASGKGWVTVVDGTSWTVELSGDGIHPTTTGQAEIAAAVGLVLP